MIDYYKERNNQNIYTDHRGFIMWQTSGLVLQVDEFYLDHQNRKGFAVKLFMDDFISQVRTTECEVHAQVVRWRQDTNKLLTLYSYYGFKIIPGILDNQVIKLYKELK